MKSLRDWYDPWILMADMIFYLGGAIFVLGMDLITHFFGHTVPAKYIMHDFKQRLDMVYTTVPFYLQEVRRAETYNKGVPPS